MYHAETAPEKPLEAVWKEAEAVYGCFPAFPAEVEYRPELSRTHLAAYGPRYVAYQNSLAISKDLKTVWDGPGMMDKGTNRRYRAAVLERGSLVEPAEMIQDFLGRAHTTSAYLQWLNE
jgi:Zn-dependent oligopeptidase